MTIVIDEKHRSILKTLLYYQIFNFPLRLDELYRFSCHPFDTANSVEESVEYLFALHLVRRHDQWVFLGETSDIRDRRTAEDQAERVLPRALRRSRLIARFPFVRAVALSGTLSKGIFSAGDDVDYFVITTRSRLWICRFFLMAFKKIFLLNSRRNFCINYFITEDNLTIPDQNRFTAAEIAWLKPTVNSTLFANFFANNPWTRPHLPNWHPEKSGEVSHRPYRFSLVERILAGSRGDRFDDRCRRTITAHNRRKYSALDVDQFNLALRAGPNVSKHHPRSLQAKVLKQFSEAVRVFEELHGIDLGSDT